MNKELQGLVEKLEATPTLPPGPDERFNGYAGMGVPFKSGHILAMRRFSFTSIGPGYTSVWHRNPAGEWFFYTTAPARQSLPALLWRYGIGLCANRYPNSMEGRQPFKHPRSINSA